MNKHRICVYAIARNEEKFAARWAQSMSEADEIVVLDTGSDDRTVDILSAFPKVTVYSRAISPWRFDAARNLSLSLVPEEADYCVCTDLDEIFEKGWRQALEEALASDPDLVSYRYTWSFNRDKTENTVFNIEKTHRRHGFIWTHPVHEVLTFTENGTPSRVFAKNVRLYHFPDSEKSREQYLPLLELSVRECPTDDRNMHYLGREYMFHRRYEEAIDTLQKHLLLESARWSDERCASMRYIARCLAHLNKPSEAFLWLLRACIEAPHLREPLIEAAQLLYEQKSWHGVIFFCERALEITSRTETYITDAASWAEKPYDLLSVAYYYAGDVKKAVGNARQALSYAPDNERIKGNLALLEAKLA